CSSEAEIVTRNRPFQTVVGPRRNPRPIEGVRSHRGRNAMSWAPAPLRRVALALAVLAGLAIAAGAVLWAATPDPSDIQSRVAALTRARGTTLLGEND